MQTCNRESPIEKIESLVKSSESLIEEIEHMAYLKALPVNFSFKRMNYLRDFSTLISFFINFWMISFYHYELDPKDYASAVMVFKLCINKLT